MDGEVPLGFDAGDVGRALERNRRLARMTQAQVAELMGTTQSAISRAERGRVMPGVAFIERFSRAIGKPFLMDLGPRARGADRAGLRLASLRPGDTSRGKQDFAAWERWEMRKVALETSGRAASGAGAAGSGTGESQRPTHER